MRDIFSLRDAILATIQYFDLFDFSLTLDELTNNLYGWSAPREAVKAEVNIMQEIAQEDGLYFLKGRLHSGLRKEKNEIAEQMWKRVAHFGFIFALCPFVRMAAVVNTLAYGNVSRTSDIDLFVIVEPGRLSTARFFAKIFTQIFGVRVHHEKKAFRFCLSFFVTTRAMDLRGLAHPFDPHLAYFVKTAVPIYGSDLVCSWIKANHEWTLPYFRRPLIPDMNRVKPHRLARIFQALAEGIISIFGNLPEKIFSSFQTKKDLFRKKQYAHSRGIIITRDIFKFHEHDPREEIAERFLAL